jgi:hypothetical protein
MARASRGVYYGTLASQQEEDMAQTTGEVVETPTAELPYKAVISHDGELIGEQYFSSRIEAEDFHR